jgi:hypothetical protein
MMNDCISRPSLLDDDQYIRKADQPLFAWRRPIRLMVWGSACVYYVTTSFLIIIFSLIFLFGCCSNPFWVVVVGGGSFQYDHE